MPLTQQFMQNHYYEQLQQVQQQIVWYDDKATAYNYKEGSLKKGLLHGKGKIKSSKTGAVYNVTFKKGYISQLTSMSHTFINNNITTENEYSGEFKNFQPHGNGTLTIKEKLTYNGTLTIKDKLTYKGEFISGDFDGKGKITYADGIRFVGTFKNNKPHGKGTYSYPDGSSYEGEVEDGRLHGVGKLTTQEGTIYDGNWDNNYYLRKQANEEHECYLTGALMKDPVRLNGIWCDKSALLQSIKEKEQNPFNRLPLTEEMMIVDEAQKEEIKQWKQKYAVHLKRLLSPTIINVLK